MDAAPGTRWTNASVQRLLESAHSTDPTEVIAAKAQHLALSAMEEGWEGPPFDPFALAGRLGVAVVARNDVADARLSMTESGPRIEFNPGRRPARVRFSLAHELAHLLFEDFAEQVRERHDTDPRHGDDWQLEMLCNIGASEFLMPVGAFPKERIDDLSLSHLLDVRSEYQVSTEAVLRRAIRLTDRPAAVFVATREEDGSARIDYATSSRSWRSPVQGGWRSSEESVLRRVTAVGYSVDNHERWNSSDLYVQAVGVPPYGGHRFPRIVGLLTPDDESATSGGAGIGYVRGDATQPDVTGAAVLAHVVNNAARAWGGHGFAAALATRRPEVHDDYQAWVAHERPRLGAVHWSKTEAGLEVASMVAQAGYGEGSAHRLRLGALQQCLSDVAVRARAEGATVHMPLIGTGYGGGRWAAVRDLVLDTVCSEGVPVKVYVLPEATMPQDVDSQLSLLS
jgi:Zn-dependent peptidase ImmA (M78 family)/O-acetyl-ADP-ribose deacetylase (regulator of RNase III)